MTKKSSPPGSSSPSSSSPGWDRRTRGDISMSIALVTVALFFVVSGWISYRTSNQDSRLVIHLITGILGLLLSGAVTFLVRRSSTIRERQEWLQKVIDDAATGMALVSPSGPWLRVNKALCDLVGYSEEELLKMDFLTIAKPDDFQIQMLRSELLAGTRRTYQVEKRYIRKDGKSVWVLLNVSLVRDHNQAPLYFIGQVLDISDRKAASLRLEEYAVLLEHQKEDLVTANDKLEMMATTDGLTGLANRRRFDEEFAHLFSSAQRYKTPLSVLIIDVDNFKSVNDMFGHLTGDAILCQVASLLKHGARDSDIVARYGGEEFAVICPQTDLDSAAFLAGRLRKTIEDFPFDCGRITASFGVAALNSGDAAVKDLVLRADSALYRSKNEGRNQVNSSGPETALAA